MTIAVDTTRTPPTSVCAALAALGLLTTKAKGIDPTGLPVMQLPKLPDGGGRRG